MVYDPFVLNRAGLKCDGPGHRVVALTLEHLAPTGPAVEQKAEYFPSASVNGSVRAPVQVIHAAVKHERGQVIMLMRASPEKATCPASGPEADSVVDNVVMTAEATKAEKPGKWRRPNARRKVTHQCKMAAEACALVGKRALGRGD